MLDCVGPGLLLAELLSLLTFLLLTVSRGGQPGGGVQWFMFHSTLL